MQKVFHLQQAFNGTLDHFFVIQNIYINSNPVLISELEYYGVCGTPLDLLKYYLKNRTPFTSLITQLQKPLKVTSAIKLFFAVKYPLMIN